MPIFEIETDQGIFEIDADREPTQAEALQAISAQVQPSSPTAGELRRASVEPQLAQQAALEQQNLEQVYGGIPFRGAGAAYTQAADAAKDLAGQGLAGDLLALLSGGGAALGTGFNFITKAGSNLANIYRAAGENLAGTAVGGVNKGGAILRGEQEAQPFVKVGDTTSTAANLGAMILNAAQTEPVNAALAIGGGIEGARNPSGLVRGAARPIEAAIEKITPNIVKRGAEVVTSVPDAFKKDVGRVATDVFKPTTDTAKADLIKDIESGALHDDLRAVQEFGKPKNAEQMLENGLVATDNLINLHKDFVSQFPDEIINNGDISASIRAEVGSKELSSPREKRVANTLAEKIDGDRSLDRSFKLLQELNERRANYYDKSQKGQATDLDNIQNALEQKARDMLSEKLDNFYRSKTGSTDNPYRQYGSLKGRLDEISLRLNNLLTERNIQVSKGPSLDREVLSTVKKNLSLLKGGEKGRIDNRIARMFDLLGKEERTNLRDLNPEEILSLANEPAPVDLNSALQKVLTSEDLNQLPD